MQFEVSSQIQRIIALGLIVTLIVPLRYGAAEETKEQRDAITALAKEDAWARDHADEKEPIQIRLGQPNVWSLEQAHYMLERIRANDNVLTSKVPGEDILDPNTTNGTRIDILRTLFKAAVEFNTVKGATNDAAFQAFQVQLDRKRQLQQRLDDIRARQIEIALRLADLNAEKARLSADTTSSPQARQAVEDEIARLKEEKTVLDSQVTNVAAELKDTAVTAPTAAAPAPTAEALTGDLAAKDIVGEALKSSATGLTSPKLGASIALDNHIQFQYEMLVKQLTLLRDEVGPDRRVIFLELPLSIYTQPGKSEDHLVQVRWSVEKICSVGNFNQQLHQYRSHIAEARQSDAAQDHGNQMENDCPEHRKQKRVTSAEEGTEGDSPNQKAPGFQEILSICRSAGSPIAEPPGQAIDLIPRQAALNVNQMYDRTRGFSINAVLGLFRFGANAQLQRQRQLFEQFIHQDVYASGFGKGRSEFGWTLGPLPGTNRIAPGTRAMYAVLAIPRDAVALKLRADAVAYPFDKLPLFGRNEGQTFDVTLPTGIEGFYVTSVDYTPVHPGKRVTVVLEGEDFSPQLGVLINGVALRRSVSLARPGLISSTITLASLVGAAVDNVDGEYEIVNSRKILLSFSIGGNYEGTPTITLVAPQKVASINRFTLKINHQRCSSTLVKLSKLEPMFLGRPELLELQLPIPIPEPPALARENHDDAMEELAAEIDSGADSASDEREAVRVKPRETLACPAMKARLIGRGLRPEATIFINGVYTPSQQVSTTLYLLCPPPLAGTSNLDVAFSQRTLEGAEEASLRMPDPRALRVKDYEVLRLREKASSTTMDVRLEVIGLLWDPQIFQIGDDPKCPKRLPSERFSKSEILVTGVNGAESPVLLKLVTDRSTPPQLITVVVPKAPTIRAIVAEPSGKNSGLTTGNYNVHLRGRSLETVTRVLFGEATATVTSTSSSEIVVQAPANAAGAVQVRLETNVKFLGRLLNNDGDLGTGRATFNYEAPK